MSAPRITGDLLDEHRAGIRASAEAAEARRVAVLAADPDARVIAEHWPCPDVPGARCVRWADGSESWCANWNDRPRGWGEASAVRTRRVSR